jgi:hypothetical protein
MTDTTKLLPPLPHLVLQGILRVQDSALRALKNCKYPGTDTLNSDCALEILCSCAIEEARLRLDFYESLPGFSNDWTRRIGIAAINSSLACFPQYEFASELPRMVGVDGKPVIEYENARQFLAPVERAVLTYVSQRAVIGGRAKASSKPANRKQLRDAYFAHFPDERIVIRDLCWAAQQHYREWKRWLDEELKDGTTPDLAFRRCAHQQKKAQRVQSEATPEGLGINSPVPPVFPRFPPVPPS